MHKEELIQLHTLLVRVKNYFEDHTFCNGEFERYNSLHIGPMHIHRSKAEHKHAIFVLGNELASVMDSEELSGTGRISARMQELAARTENDKTPIVRPVASPSNKRLLRLDNTHKLPLRA